MTSDDGMESLKQGPALDPSSPQWQVLLLISTGVESAEQRAELERLLTSPALQWGELIEQALRQKVLPLLAYYLTRPDVTAPMPVFLRRHLQTTLDCNRHRLAVFRREAVRIVAALKALDVRFVATKGITFESTLYGGSGARFMNDLDFMILPTDRERVRVALRDAGYTEGLFDWGSREIKPLSRRREITYRLNPDHLPMVARLTGDPIVPCIHVDIANSLTWHGSEYEVPVERALAGIEQLQVPDADVTVPTFAPSFQLIFTALHLFREAWLEQWIDWEQDVNLIKFADLARLWRAMSPRLDAGEFCRLVDAVGIAAPMSWVLEHLDRTLATDAITTLGLCGRASEEWLHSAGGRQGKPRSWRGTMHDRLLAKDRRSLFSQE